MPGYRLRDYPLAIEPTVSRLELRARLATSDDLLCSAEKPPPWCMFYRLSPAVVRAGAAVELPSWLPHYFGDAEAITDCQLVLGYDGRGILFTVLIRSDETGQLERDDVPVEVTGSVPVAPSVRIAFQDITAREKFLTYINDVLAGHQANYDMSQLLHKSRMIICDVGETHE